jgi:hypothetical protein
LPSPHLLKANQKRKTKNKEQQGDDDQTITPDEQMQQLDYIRSHPAEFVDFNIPWNVQLSYSLSFSRILFAKPAGFHHKS